MERMLRTSTALAATLGLANLVIPAHAQSVTAQPFPGSDVAPYFINPASDPAISTSQLIQLLRQRVKYVFIIFNENHSFDNEYGTFPGVNGIYSDGQNPRSAANTPGFTQTYVDLNGNTVTVQPFLTGPQQNATFTDSVDHSHTGLARKLNVVNGVAQMNQFSYDEYYNHAKAGNSASQAQGTQFARLVMSHMDCNTIPFFWQYASRFTIFDNIFATEDTPSTPNAIAMIAGQSGETQWVKHGPAGLTGSVQGTIQQQSGSTIHTLPGATAPIQGTASGLTETGTATTQGPPIVNDPQPYWGSFYDTTVTNRQPTGPKENWTPSNTASNLTFATVPLTAMGNQIKNITSQDYNPNFDLPDIQQDIPYIYSLNGKQVSWRWYQNGYGVEKTDAATGVTGTAYDHQNFVSHHDGAQYFGYLANNPAERSNFKGETDFFTDMANNNLPANGGIFYIRGGYYNLNYASVVPPIQNKNYPPRTAANTPPGLTASDIATIDVTKSGDDDHPSYSDRQISEAMNAKVINAIASNQTIWNQSAIILTYDESDGFYDHVPPRILAYGPDSLPLSRGIRVPLILISPFARVHAVSHAEGDHNAVIETINAIFNLPALSSLPDEAQALAAGNSPAFNQFATQFGPAGFQQQYLGPRDTPSAITDSLLSGFEPKRLMGTAPPLHSAYAMIPDSVINSFPHYGGNGCQAIGITPEDQRQGIVNTIPPNFNTLPSTLPQYN